MLVYPNRNKNKTVVQPRMAISKELLIKAGKGDDRAQYELYRAVFPLLISVCSRYHKDEQSAVAALNVGFLKILHKYDTIREDVPIEAWMRRIMINTLIDEFRKNKTYREQTVLVDEIHENGIGDRIDWNEAEQRFNIQQLEGMIRRLPPVTMQVFDLFAIDGYTHHEIGELLGMSDGTSKWHVNAARKKLKDWIQKEIINFQGI